MENILNRVDAGKSGPNRWKYHRKKEHTESMQAEMKIQTKQLNESNKGDERRTNTVIIRITLPMV